MMGLAMQRYVHSEKYRSNIKKMYQNSYSLHVAIKTGALWRPACSVCLTILPNISLFLQKSHTVLYTERFTY